MESATVSRNENRALLIMAIASWFISITVLLPIVCVLMVSSSLRKVLYNWNMKYKTIGIDMLAKDLFVILRDSCPQFDFRKLRFLELGTRPSFSFDEYAEQHEIDVACENSEYRGKGENTNKKIQFFSSTDAFKDCKENTYDVVVSTFFLCSVKNPQTALNDIRRILKPGGKFAFLEHCGFPENESSFKFQRLISPLWLILFGCRLSHHPSHLLKYSSFHSLNYKTYYNKNRLVFYRPVIVGVCTK